MKRTRILSFWASRSIGDCDVEILVVSLMLHIVVAACLHPRASITLTQSIRVGGSSERRRSRAGNRGVSVLAVAAAIATSCALLNRL